MGMSKLLSSALILAISLSSTLSFASNTEKKGLLTLSSGQKIYVDYQMPKKGYPTLILLNGLTYDTTNWDLFVNQINDIGIGILRYDMRGQGKTLKASEPIKSPIPFMQQVEDLKELISIFKFDQKPLIMGLSYGGGIALAYAKTYPDTIAHAILMAPYTQPLESQDKLFKFIISTTNFIRSSTFQAPLDYETAYSALLANNVKKIYPLVEPGNWDGDAVLNLTEGIRKWNAQLDPSVPRIPEYKVTLMAAVFDQYVEYHALADLAQLLGPSLREFDKIWSEHKIPESNPSVLKMELLEILHDKLIFPHYPEGTTTY